MSYNTRRSGGNQSYNNGMGGRGRGGMNQNFVSSGQYQTPQKPGGVNQVRPQQQQQNVRPQNQQTPQPQRQPAPQQQQQPAPQQQQQPGPQQQQQQQFGSLRQPSTPLPPAPLKSALKKEVKSEPQTPKANPPQQQQQQVMQTPPKPVVTSTPVAQTPAKPVVQQQPAPAQPGLQPAVPPTLPVKPEGMETENGNIEGKKKILVMKGKISKKEKRGRRNRRLRKILVPKNALMVLNELVGGHKFTFLEKDPNQLPTSFNYVENDTYIASVTIDGSDHIGYGKSKTAAKTAAAENALRHIILSKISSPLGAAVSTQSVDTDAGGDQPMEVDGEKQEEEDVSWLHVASFAMHKLFSSWYADGDEKLDQAKILARTGPAEMVAKLQEIKQFPGPPKTRKPAKQLPQNPQLLNPVMLLNQMRDDVTYEEFSKTGTAPHITFIIKTTVEGQEFFGKGGNKKIARKNCAYAACRKLYGIDYPADEFDPSTASESSPMF